ncbi:Fic family protein [bacterium]|nr:Fic family protein [bacterium]
MRTFEKTHPWLTFTLDLGRARHDLWLMLGEAQAKCEYLANLPLRPATAKRLHELYLAKGALATTAIEGNTLTEEDALKLVEGRLSLPPSKEYLSQEINNIIEACNIIGTELLTGTNRGLLSVKKINEFNDLVLKNLELPEQIVPGKIRNYSVGVELVRYRAAPPDDCEYLLKRLCDWLNQERSRAPKGHKLAFALIRAVLAHLYLAWIHPYGDGNGRTARLVEFQILLDAGIPTIAAHLLSNHYNQTRNEYYKHLDQASKSGGNVIPFIQYAIEGFLDGLGEQMQKVSIEVLDIAWKDYVHEAFRDKKGKTARRQRQLALAISNKGQIIPKSEIRELSPRVAESYASKTAKTISRDLNSLVKMDIIEIRIEGVRAKKEKMLSFR